MIVKFRSAHVMRGFHKSARVMRGFHFLLRIQ